MKPIKQSKILVTGSRGFIGRHLTQRLLKEGAALTLIDIIEENHVSKNVTRINSSFGDTEMMRKVLPGHDAVFHLGAMVGVDATLKNQSELKRVNLDETKRFLDLAAQAGVKKIVFSSSSEIYGTSKKFPLKESFIVRPISRYAQYKADIEQHLRKLALTTSTRISVVRFFNVYGPGQRDDFVINRFIAQARSGHDLMVNWDGTQTRCFTFVDDAVNGLIQAMQYDKKPFDIFNIGSGEETTILGLAKLIIEMSQAQSNIIIVNQDKVHRYDVARRVPSLQKSKRSLEYAPKTSLRQGIKRILNVTR